VQRISLRQSKTLNQRAGNPEDGAVAIRTRNSRLAALYIAFDPLL
jgi:hypothetical protein